ncbi:MAG: hypothetical protein K0R39_2518 [Symbiobacteriaceae bacterium]|nr:hypothetical protein [Symbiobacteriaceae bacterium]
MGEQEQFRRRAERDADGSDLAEFRETHRRLSDRVERVIMQFVILGLVAVVLYQTFATIPSLRAKLNLMEGTDGLALREDSSWWRALAPGATEKQAGGSPAAVSAAAGQAAAAEKHSLTVLLETTRSAPKVKLLVGGRAVATFATGQVSAQVKAGELIAIDASSDDRELTFRVVKSEGLTSPALNAEVTTQGDQKSLGVARKASH